MSLYFKPKTISYLLIFGISLMLSACGGSSQNKKSTDGPANIPEAVKKVVAASSNKTIHLSWEKSSGASSYNVYFAKESFKGDVNGYANLDGGELRPDVDSNTFEVDIEELENQTTYYFIVTAVNKNGESKLSSEVTGIPFESDILTGSIDSVKQGQIKWGSEGNKLCSSWSIARFHPLFPFSGWFEIYNAAFEDRVSDLEMYVLKPPQKITDINNAEEFTFETAESLADEGATPSIEVFEGETIIFRGTNGYYGAWEIMDIKGSSIDATLTGKWYFIKTKGSSDFTSSLEVSPESFEASADDCPYTLKKENF